MTLLDYLHLLARGEQTVFTAPPDANLTRVLIVEAIAAAAFHTVYARNELTCVCYVHRVLAELLRRFPDQRDAIDAGAVLLAGRTTLLCRIES
jgi:hypothetical protein